MPRPMRGQGKSTEKVSVRLTEAELEELKAEAAQLHLKLSDLMRTKILRRGEVASRPSLPPLQPRSPKKGE